ncbi:MAG TPA: BatD family protein [Candidatus Omnitrophota bacterium]|nr:BatD family protein [Candidatus Omnitrophota bacterium]
MRKILFILAVLGCAFAPRLDAEEVRVSASLNKRSVQVGEDLRLNIRVTGQTMNLQAPRLPALDGFEAYYTGRASHIAFVNGVSSSNVEFSYTLIPQRAGRFTINSVDVQVGQNVLRTEPLEIEVIGGQAQPARTQPSPQTVPAMQAPAPMRTGNDQNYTVSPGTDDNIFVQAGLDKKEAYQNEQVLLTYTLFTRYDTRYEGFEREPETSGFWIEEFPMDRDVPRETVRTNGKRYVKADVKKLALFPTAPGNYTIKPGSLKVSIREEPQGSSAFDEFFSDSFFTGGSFFARRQNRLLEPPPIQLTVKPLPEERKPASFQGAVGSFRMTALIDKDKVKQNEPITLKMIIEGDGNIETLTRPKVPALTGFKTYDADTNSKLFQTDNVIGGTKSFEVVFIPKDEGKSFIPPLEFSYFDPRQRKYVTLRTPNFPVEVEHSDQAFQMPQELAGNSIFQKRVKSEGKDIRYINEKLPDISKMRTSDTVYKALLWGNALLFILLIALWMKDRQDRLFSKDEALRRRKTARSTAMANMSRLKKLARSSKEEDVALFFVELEKAMTQYIADKWNFSTYGVTRRDLEETLTAHFGAGDAHLQDVLELFRLCDESRFGKGSIPAASKKIGLKIFEDAVNRIERMRK